MFTSLRWLAVLGVCWCVAETSAAAETLKPPTDFEVSRVKNFIYQARAGTLPVIDPDSKDKTDENKKALQTFANWLLFTLTQAPYNGEVEPKDAPKPPPGVERTADFLIRELEAQVELVPAPGFNRISVNQVQYGEEMGKAINNAARKVLENAARPIELTNAVRMMAITSKMPAPALADTFVEIINNEKHSDAIKLFAFHGLRRLLEQYFFLDQTKHVIGATDNTKLVAVTDALSKYILKNRTPRDAREATVIQYVRTEAVAALARCRESVIRKPNNEVISRPAWTLAHVFAADPNITPGFTVIERSEAAMGFAQMKIDKDINLDVGAYFVGQALAAFVLQMSQDYANVNKGMGLPAYPWKIYSARWSFALATWRENSKASRSKNAEVVKSLADTSIADILKEVERSAEKAIYNTDNLFRVWPQNNQPKAWLEATPKQAILFADDPTSILPFAVNAKLTTPPMPAPMPMTPAPMPMPKMPPKK